MTWGKVLTSLASAAAFGTAVPAVSQSARISGLSDIDFGSITNTLDRSSSQNVIVCSYRNNPHRLPYAVTATGSGSGGAYLLSSGAATLPFDVQWSDTAGQTGGTMLQAGSPSSGFGNGATGFACPSQSVNASLTVTVRSADLATASAGTYAGTLQVTIVPQ